MIDKQKYFVIGHITNDQVVSPNGTSSEAQLGGSVFYCAAAAQKLGLKAHIITRCKTDHPYIRQITKMDITVHCLPPEDKEGESHITSFTNKYDHHGGRSQTVNNIQAPITSSDLEQLLAIITKDSIIHLAPVMSEVEKKLIKLLKNRGCLVVTPQGYFRCRQKDGSIIQRRWKDIKNLSYAHVTILSTEDIVFNNILDRNLVKHLQNICPLFILTKQKNGSIIFPKGKKPIQINAYQLSKEQEKDLTGAGDTYATAFVVEYLKSGNLTKAGNFASYLAAKKISNPEYFR